MTTAHTRPKNLLIVASSDWPVPTLATVMVARWHAGENRPHFVLHVIGDIGDEEFVANPTIYTAATDALRAGGGVQQHDPTEQVGLGERRAIEASIEEAILRPKPGEEIDHVIALIFNNDRMPSVAIMHANMTSTPNTIIRINDNGRI